MGINKFFLMLGCLLSGTVIMGLLSLAEASAAPPHQESPLQAPAKGDSNSGPSRNPQFISIQLEPPIRTLVAGENGSVQLKASLGQAQNSSTPDLAWDWKAKTPLTVWISTPPDSGISFLDPVHPDRPRHHLLVKFNSPEEEDGRVLTRKLNIPWLPGPKPESIFFGWTYWET